MTTRKKDDTTPPPAPDTTPDTPSDATPDSDVSRDTGAPVSRDTSSGDTTPDGYERGHVAFAGGVPVAFGATVEDALSESAAAGHDQPIIVAGMRPAPERDDR